MDRQSSTGSRVPVAGRVLSRRKIFKGAVGAAAAGAAGGALVARPKGTPPASPGGAGVLPARLTAAEATTTAPGAAAPAVVVLVDATTIAIDASLGNDFRVTIAGNRTIGTPSNPTDGQKITFQVTQGASGSAALSWTNAYEFSTALPQPTLSTAAGQTDLLGFIYNADIGKWLFVAQVTGFASTTIAQPAGTYRLFDSIHGPDTAASYSGSLVCGVVTGVTTGGCWLQGYWWWVCPSGQSTAAQKFALWCLYGATSGSLVANSTVTSGALTAGQWNYVPLPVPVPLASGATYVVATGLTGNFPITNDQFGSGDPYANGIVSGPLTAYSDSTGSLPSPLNTSQGVFSVASSDPAGSLPAFGSNTSNFWTDLQVATSAPTGASYRIWPSYPTLPGHLNSDTAGYTLATEFQLSVSVKLENIWFYSASGASALPTRCAIWDASSQTVVSGTDNSSPTWSGAAGAGWVSCAYSGVTLPTGDYKVAVYYAGGTQWYQATTSYWGAGGPGSNGITNGPVSAPSAAAASSPGQSTYSVGSWSYPQTYVAAGDGENYWVDIEVTPTD